MTKIAVAFTVFFLWVSNVQAQTSFFAGKTIRIIVGLPAGDVYDIYARISGRAHGKVYSRKSQHHRSKHARRIHHDRR